MSYVLSCPVFCLHHSWGCYPRLCMSCTMTRKSSQVKSLHCQFCRMYRTQITLLSDPTVSALTTTSKTDTQVRQARQIQVFKIKLNEIKYFVRKTIRQCIPGEFKELNLAPSCTDSCPPSTNMVLQSYLEAPGSRGHVQDALLLQCLVDVGTTVRLHFRMAADQLVELQAHQAGHSGGSGGDSWDDPSGDQLALWAWGEFASGTMAVKLLQGLNPEVLIKDYSPNNERLHKTWFIVISQKPFRGLRLSTWEQDICHFIKEAELDRGVEDSQIFEVQFLFSSVKYSFPV